MSICALPLRNDRRKSLRTKILASAFVLASLVSSIAAQSGWSCPDDGTVTVATNQGTNNVTYTLHMSAQSQYDTALKIVVFKENDDGEEILASFEWNWGTDPQVILGPGCSVRIEDPADTDTKVGNGTYTT